MTSFTSEDSVSGISKLVNKISIQPTIAHPLLNNNDIDDCEAAEEALTTDSEEYLAEPIRYKNFDFSMTSHNSSLTLTPNFLPSPEGTNNFLTCLNVITFNNVEVPIVGYEVMEERARFTVFKLRIDNKITGDCWYVFRRYTDFVRLCNKLKQSHPHIIHHLPRKRWLGNNFDPLFLEERVNGLQTLVNAILSEADLVASPQIQEFFCFNEPPSVSDATEESRAILEVFEESIYQLRKQLKEKEMEIDALHDSLHAKLVENDNLRKVIKNSTMNCQKCQKEYENISKALSRTSLVTDNQSFSSPTSSTTSDL